jgi:hypothetical protein
VRAFTERFSGLVANQEEEPGEQAGEDQDDKGEDDVAHGGG